MEVHTFILGWDPMFQEDLHSTLTYQVNSYLLLAPQKGWLLLSSIMYLKMPICGLKC